MSKGEKEKLEKKNEEPKGESVQQGGAGVAKRPQKPRRKTTLTKKMDGRNKEEWGKEGGRRLKKKKSEESFPPFLKQGGAHSMAR